MKDTELIKGNWYKCIDWSDDIKDQWYIRFDRLIRNKIYYSEQITTSLDKHEQYSSRGDSTESWEFKEVSLEDIKQYIPNFKNYLLNICKEKYPVGTKFNTIELTFNTTFKSIINYQDFRIYTDTSSYITGITNGNNDWLYIDGKFAEIIENQQDKDMKKEIIGYKLKNLKHRKAALALCPGSMYLSTDRLLNRADKPYLLRGCENHIALQEAGVLDLWFEPVYVKELSLPKLGGYEGKLEGNTLSYGCKSVDINDVIQLTSSLENVSISICDSGADPIVDFIGFKVKLSELLQIRDYRIKNL